MAYAPKEAIFGPVIHYNWGCKECRNPIERGVYAIQAELPGGIGILGIEKKFSCPHCSAKKTLVPHSFKSRKAAINRLAALQKKHALGKDFVIHFIPRATMAKVMVREAEQSEVK